MPKAVWLVSHLNPGLADRRFGVPSLNSLLYSRHPLDSSEMLSEHSQKCINCGALGP